VPRALRNFEPGGIYHVTARGNRKQRIFLTDNDRELFLTLLARVALRLKWRCHAYCLMQNHYHLVAETRGENLSAGLQTLNGRYAQAFNGRYETSGHLFQGRFHAVQVGTEGHLLELSRYLALNPVRAGLCMRPEEWPWSSYRALAGIAPAPDFLDVKRLLDYWGMDAGRAPQRFQQFVREAALPFKANTTAKGMPGVRPRPWHV
jgi:putative transposase